MRVFVDTNVLLEYIFNREQADVVDVLYNAVRKDSGINLFIAQGSFYTITYMMEYSFKEQGIRNPQKVTLLRRSLAKVLSLFRICGLTGDEFLEAVRDKDFTDLEDSYQCHTAESNGCQTLITFNVKDFRKYSRGKIEILSPQDFVKKYINS